MVKTFFLSLIVFLGIDFIWLSTVSKSFYDKQFSNFKRTLRLVPAGLSYLLLVLGIVFFVLPKTENPSQALLYGALFGLITYGTYDLVNLATLSDWTLKMTAVDIAWGATVCGLVSLVVKLIIK